MFTAAVFFMVYHVYRYRRYAKYNTVNGVEERTLYKAFGIRFDIMVFGQVGFVYISLFSLVYKLEIIHFDT